MPPQTIFRLVSTPEAAEIAKGTILFLPPREIIPKDTILDEELQAGAFNHPVVVISCPKKMDWESVVEICIMTSFNNTPLRKHLASKGIKHATTAIAAQKSGYLRVVTASKPYATDTLKLRAGKGMKRDSSYVGIRKSYRVQVKALALYGGKGEGVGAYRLTAHAGRVLGEGVSGWRGRRVVDWIVGKEGKDVKKVKERKVEKKGEVQGGDEGGKKVARGKGRESEETDDIKISKNPTPGNRDAKLTTKLKPSSRPATRSTTRSQTRTLGKSTGSKVSKKEAPATIRRRTSLRIAELSRKMMSKNIKKVKAEVGSQKRKKATTKKTADSRNKDMAESKSKNGKKLIIKKSKNNKSQKPKLGGKNEKKAAGKRNIGKKVEKKKTVRKKTKRK